MLTLLFDLPEEILENLIFGSSMILIMASVDDFAIILASLKLESELGKVVQLERLIHEL